MNFLIKYKYEILLFGLLDHLFIGIFLTDLNLYISPVWLINMLILAISCYGIFADENKLLKTVLQIVTLIICCLPILASIIGFSKSFMVDLSIFYTFYFALIFYKLIRFLTKPSYINKDIISAALCGYMLMIEMCTFLMQGIFYLQPNSFQGISTSNSAGTYIDFVYFSTITITSIGFGDILPTSHQTKLLAAVFGIFGQFYSVILVGILISKFTSKSK